MEKFRGTVVIAAFVIALVALCSIIALSPDSLVFDEGYHLEGARLLAGGATIKQMLNAPLPSAPGPLYPILHAMLFPLTGFQPHAIRYVNLILLLASISAMTFCLRVGKAGHPWPFAAMMLATPMVWITGGMALTQAPALFMATFGLAAALWATAHLNDKYLRYSGFAICGIFFGLAILGRQTYLPIIVALAVVAVVERRLRGPAIVALLITLIITCPLFLIWGGLTHRAQAHVGGGLAFSHGLLALAYLAIVFAVIAPRFYFERWRWTLTIAGIALLANFLLFHFQWRALAGVAKRLPSSLGYYYPTLVGGMIVAILAGFITATAINTWQRREDHAYILFMGLSLLLTATAFGIIHSFSSTYVMAAFPFVLLAARPFFRPSKWAAVRLLAGGAVGIISLSSYYWK